MWHSCTQIIYLLIYNSNLPFAVENGSFGGPSQEEQSALYTFLYPSKDLLPDDKEMSIFDHLEELRERIFISVLAVGAAILGCFAFSKDLVLFLEAPVTVQGVRFLQLSPGEFFFTTLKVRLQKSGANILAFKIWLTIFLSFLFSTTLHPFLYSIQNNPCQSYIQLAFFAMWRLIAWGNHPHNSILHSDCYSNVQCTWTSPFLLHGSSDV